jgi:hypothetical protein
VSAPVGRLRPALYALMLCASIGGFTFLLIGAFTPIRHDAAVLVGVLVGAGARSRVVRTRGGFRLGPIRVACGVPARRTRWGRRSG